MSIMLTANDYDPIFNHIFKEEKKHIQSHIIEGLLGLTAKKLPMESKVNINIVADDMVKAIVALVLCAHVDSSLRTLRKNKKIKDDLREMITMDFYNGYVEGSLIPKIQIMRYMAIGFTEKLQGTTDILDNPTLAFDKIPLVIAEAIPEFSIFHLKHVDSKPIAEALEHMKKYKPLVMDVYEKHLNHEMYI